MRKAHKTLLWVLAALGIMSGAVAHAQVSLNSLAPNTVVGRLGAGQTGPAQAIPFATLLAQLNGLPTLISGPGSVTSGHVVTWGSTNTSLLDSGIASSLVAQNATASPAAGCVQFDGSSHLTSTGANCGNAGATAPGGSTTQVQFNSSGAFAASGGFTYASSTLTLNPAAGTSPADIYTIPPLKVVNDPGVGVTGIENYNAGAAPALAFINMNNTYGSPTATTTGLISTISFRGYDTTGFRESASIQVLATQTWTSSAWGTKVLLSTTPNGSTTETTALTIDQDQSLTVAGNLRTNGTLTANSTSNSLMLPLSGNTTLNGDTINGILTTNSSHWLVSQSSFFLVNNFLTQVLQGTFNSQTYSCSTISPSGTGSGFCAVGLNPGIVLMSLGTPGGTNPVITTAGGTDAGGFTPGASINTTTLGDWFGYGYTGSGWAIGAIIQMQATQTWTGTANGAKLIFFANQNGTNFAGQDESVASMDFVNGIKALNNLPIQGSDVVAYGAAASPPGGGGIAYGGTTAVSANCGSLAGASACIIINVAGTTRYIPYY